jgi:putative phage-type endonuclease
MEQKMDTSELIQGSDEWIKARIGSLGASRVAEALAKTKSGWGSSRANLQAEIIAERLTGTPADQYISAAMRAGTETEPEARAAYAFYSDTDVEQVGLIRHPKIAGTHASPDGRIGKRGLLELKCPLVATHIETLLGGAIPGKYIIQCQWQMACCAERQWVDWASYNPRLPEQMRLFVQRVKRDDVMIADLEKEVAVFLAEISQTILELEIRFGKLKAA